MNQTIAHIVNKLKQHTNAIPEVAIVLGSGLGNFVKCLEQKKEIAYAALKGLPKSTVAGHSGKFIFGKIEGVSVVCMQGRFHLYEGYSAKQVTLPIYVLKELGVKTLVVTNASGAVNTSYSAGDLMIINDHINFTGQNPLVGEHNKLEGSRFIDMSDAYHNPYVTKLNEIAKKQNIEVKNGTYIQFLGPNYETPAEVKMARIMGADAVGMSTVIEVIAGVDAGLKIAGVSAISNMAVGVSDEAVTHEKVLETMKLTEQKFTKLLVEFVKQLN
jgi:purine-nucleoside phosphorylase